MDGGCAVIDVLDGGAKIAPDAVMGVVHIADINLAFCTIASAFRDRSVVCHKLRLIDSFRLTIAPTEEGRHANTIALTIRNNIISKTINFVNLHRACVLFAGHSLLGPGLTINLLPTTLQLQPVSIQTRLLNQKPSMRLPLFPFLRDMLVLSIRRSSVLSCTPAVLLISIVRRRLLKNHISGFQLV